MIMKKRQICGFTLVELMITVAVASVVLALAVPNFRNAIQNNKFVANSNQLASAFKYARSEAIKRRTQVKVCGLNGTKNDCASPEVTNWATNGFGAKAGTTLLKVWLEPTEYDDITLTSSAASISYTSSGMLDGGSAVGVRVSFTDVTDNRCIQISTTGRVNTETIASADACP
jgi:type IV fimbrial biogenesis protein FimT